MRFKTIVWQAKLYLLLIRTFMLICPPVSVMLSSVLHCIVGLIWRPSAQCLHTVIFPWKQYQITYYWFHSEASEVLKNLNIVLLYKKSCSGCISVVAPWSVKRTLSTQLLLTRRLPGLMSRCKMPAEWRYLSPGGKIEYFTSDNTNMV